MTKRKFSRINDNVQDPVVTKDEGPIGGVRINHPAFAQIQASRVSGHTALYDSDFMHQHYIVLRICESELHRSLRDHHYDGKQLIEVAMTESQWATFVSSLNVGGGVPCTLQRRGFEPVPQIPQPENRKEQFANDLADKMKDIIADLDQAIASAKTKKEAAALEKIRMQVASNIPFIAESFDEHMEGVVERAKCEVHGYANGAVQRLGLQALAERGDILSLEAPVEGEG